MTKLTDEEKREGYVSGYIAFLKKEVPEPKPEPLDETKRKKRRSSPGVYPTVTEIVNEAKALGLTGMNNQNMYALFDQGKLELEEAVVRRELRAIHQTVPERTGNFREDLVTFATAYYDYFAQSHVLMLMLPYIIKSETLKKALDEEQARTIQLLTEFYASYLGQHRWSPYIEDGGKEKILDRVSQALIGSIFSRVLWAKASLADMQFDAEAHVDAFLRGHGSDSEREQAVARRLIRKLADEAGLTVKVEGEDSEAGEE